MFKYEYEYFSHVNIETAIFSKYFEKLSWSTDGQFLLTYNEVKDDLCVLLPISTIKTIQT